MPITPESNQDHFGGAIVRPKPRSVVAHAGHTALVNFQLQDPQGNPMDLTAYHFADSESIAQSEPKPAIEVTIAEYIEQCRQQFWASVLQAPHGIIQFQVPLAVTADPALWNMEFSLWPDEQTRLYAGSAYLAVQPGPSQASQGIGMPSIDEVRIYLRDFPSENELIDVLDFDVSEIMLAACLCVAEWNGIPPLDGPRFTTKSFPSDYRYQWLTGICAKLFAIAAEHYARNMMPYEAGGKSLDDKNRYQQYIQRSADLRQQWQDFSTNQKAILSANAYGYAEIGGVYSGLFNGGNLYGW